MEPEKPLEEVRWMAQLLRKTAQHVGKWIPPPSIEKLVAVPVFPKAATDFSSVEAARLLPLLYGKPDQ